MQLNVPNKITIQQPTDNTTTFESKQGRQP